MSETSSLAESDPRLLHDAGWKKIQENTFTRWVNQNLALDGEQIENLATDLSDGINLIKLVQILAQRVVGQRYNKKPSLRQQKLDNVQQALNFIENDEGIKLVTIDGTHIVDGNLKLILGLIWTLIYHYSIGQHIDGDKKKGQTPKQRLMAWIKSKLPQDVPVTNFTSDWNDGMALGALVDALAPGSCSGWRQWRPDEALDNTLKAMKAAEGNLGVGRLIAPEELINPNVDEKSVMTFLSQFPRAQAKTAPKGRISGVDAEPVVGRETHFTVEVDKEDTNAVVEIFDPENKEVEATIRPVEGSKTAFNVSYEPKVVGKHEITVYGASESLNTKLGNFSVRVIPAPYLVDFKPEIEVGESQKFRVANLTDKNHTEVLVLDPRGKQSQIEPGPKIGASLAFTHRPDVPGLHSVNVFVDKRHIPGSPFALHATAGATATALVWGRGLSRKGPRVGDHLPVHVDGCDKPIKVEVRNKDGLMVHCAPVFDGLVPVTPNSKESKSRKTFEYAPLGTGPHTVEVTCNGQHLGQSPYEIDVMPKAASPVRAVGPGLEGGVSNEPAVFYVDTKGDANVLEFSTEGPSQADIKSIDNGDNTAIVSYTPQKAGVYKVNVMKNGQHIKDSPFVVMIDPEGEKQVNKPKLLPLSDTEVKVGKKFEFTVESQSTPEVKVYDPNFNPVTVKSADSGNQSLHTYEFIPRSQGKYVICTSVDKVAVDGTPVGVEAVVPTDFSKLHVYGPGVGSQVVTNKPVIFNVDTRDVICKKLEVEVTDPFGAPLDIELVQDDPAKPIQVTYTPKNTGNHYAKIYVDGVLAFDVNVDVTDTGRKFSTSSSSTTTATTTSATASERGIPRRQYSNPQHQQDASLHLMLKDVEPRHLTARIQCPDGRVENVPLVHSGNNHFTINFQPKIDGVHVIDVFHRGQRVQGSPFRMPVTLSGESKAHLVRAEGTGLQHGVVGEQQSFAILVGEAGGGELKASINGPSKADITLTDFKDGICRAEYTTDEPGLYTISLSLDEQPIHGSPFKVFISPKSQSNSPPTKRPFTGESSTSQTEHDRHTVGQKSFENHRNSYESSADDVRSVNPLQAINRDEYDNNRYQGYTEKSSSQKHEFASKYDDTNSGRYTKAYGIHNSKVGDTKYHGNGERYDHGKGEFEGSARYDSTGARYDSTGARYEGQYENDKTEDVYQKLLSESTEYDQKHRQNFLTATAADVRKVVAEGSGLYEYIPGETANFTVNTSKAGRSYLFIGVVTSKGPSEEVNIHHRGEGVYNVSYKIPDRTRAVVIVKYGDREVMGSPFTVRPR
ncbi:unnamed protein product [Bursaphelenchus okinawaensis]|uniref:Calponin-homology (CH) domain-containing protein n=1 Tax=Bursaphelenchus okinawaensis TaxID=465554 RepID=A0A811KS43_9BILA|nr:unnamed protein product [Bursaphelenchus okinawaensis]CAG9109415.1 unnamed protein product [Bursaphelenchus okinawaensis]